MSVKCVCVRVCWRGGFFSLLLFKPHFWVRGELPCQQPDPDGVRLTKMCCITLVMKTERKPCNISGYYTDSCWILQHSWTLIYHGPLLTPPPPPQKKQTNHKTKKTNNNFEEEKMVKGKERKQKLNHGHVKIWKRLANTMESIWEAESLRWETGRGIICREEK